MRQEQVTAAWNLNNLENFPGGLERPRFSPTSPLVLNLCALRSCSSRRTIKRVTNPK